MEKLPPFYVGQKIVRIAHPVELASVGQVFTCAGCFQCGGCKVWKVELKELPCVPGFGTCKECMYENKVKSYKLSNAKYFAPIHENFESISLEKVLEQETKLIGVN